MYLFQNDVFVKTFIYFMGLLFPNATFIYFFRLLHTTFISTANERGVVMFRPTAAAQDRRQIGTPRFGR